MYDNIDFMLYQDQTKGIGLLDEIPQYLTNVSNIGESQYGKYINGHLDNLKISITKNRVKIHGSSICKYYLGDNFKTLGKGDTRRAIEKISDKLHLPMEGANITRIDVAQNIISAYDITQYIPYLGESQRYNRLPQNNGLYYQNGKRNLLFYGKVHEQKIKGKEIPDLYKQRNVVRYELRFIKRLTNQFNVPEVKAKLLYDESFYIKLTERWKDEYFKIQKINNRISSMKPTGSKKDFVNNLALLALLDCGQPFVLSTIKGWQQGGYISKKQAYDLRSTVKQIGTIKLDEKGNELINELDKKVRDAAKFL